MTFGARRLLFPGSKNSGGNLKTRAQGANLQAWSFTTSTRRWRTSARLLEGLAILEPLHRRLAVGARRAATDYRQETTRTDSPIAT